jgi:hypothetical protein
VATELCLLEGCGYRTMLLGVMWLQNYAPWRYVAIELCLGFRDVATEPGLLEVCCYRTMPRVEGMWLQNHASWRYVATELCLGLEGCGSRTMRLGGM